MSKKAGKAAAAPTMTVAEQQKMSAKEQALFKQVLKFYETKQYKKALKAVEQILAKYPQNGETIAMKGLIAHAQKQKTEALALIKQGVQLNIKSHVCWHVYGLYYRADHKYPDAIKCYLQALRYDPQNQQIMRDLSNLQVQRRMYEGFTETRRKILLAKSSGRQNWIAYAIGAHLSGNYTLALHVLESLAKTEASDKSTAAEVKTPDAKYEDSELKIYRNLILQESGQSEKALADLKAIESEVVDKYYWLETHAALSMKAGKQADAEANFRTLLERNPDNYVYHAGLRTALGLVATGPAGDLQFDEKQLSAVTTLYDALTKQFPKCGAMQRLPLNWLRGDTAAFRTAVDAYMRERLRKGVPALFRDLEPLYVSAKKAEVIEQIVTGYLENLRKDLRFAAADKPKSQEPGVLLWTLYFAAHHFDRQSNPKKALALVDEGMAHTPTFIDNYMLKARIYRHAGDHVTAYHWMETARKMDTQDRYLNTKCVRFAFRANDLESAQNTVSLFLRDANQADRTGIEALNLQALYDMQVSWYEIGVAELHLRKGEVAKALKKLSAIEKHFEDWTEDQFDYHTYVLRKGTLRSYIRMIRWIDALRSHRFYFRAAKLSIQTYLALYDKAQAKAAAAAAAGKTETDDADESKMTAAEKKAYKLKKSKESAKLKKAAEEEAKLKAEADEIKRKADANKPKPKFQEGKEADPDPDGEKLAAEEPLSAAIRWLKNLQLYLPDSVDTHLLAYEVYSRKNKPLLVLQALKRGLAADPTNPDLHVAVCSFFNKWDAPAPAPAAAAGSTDVKSAAPDPIVAEVVAAERKDTPALAATSVGVAKYAAAFAAAHNKSPAHLLAAARVSKLLGNTADAIKLARTTLTAAPAIDTCEEVLAFLQSLGAQTDADDFKRSALLRFPYTPAFGAVRPALPGAAAPAAGAGADAKDQKQA